MRSASCSFALLLGSTNIACVKVCPSWPGFTPVKYSSTAEPTAVPTAVACCRPIPSRTCSRSACAISWPMTAATSASVRSSCWSRPVYTAILPPGMHQALTSSTVHTLTSHCQRTASSRNTAVCGMSRWAMRCTRAVCIGSRLRAPLWAATCVTCPYCCLAVAATSAALGVNTDICCGRATPTTPPRVVCTVWQLVTTRDTPKAPPRMYRRSLASMVGTSSMQEYRKCKRPFPPTARAHLIAHPTPPAATSQPCSRSQGRLAGRLPLGNGSGVPTDPAGARAPGYWCAGKTRGHWHSGDRSGEAAPPDHVLVRRHDWDPPVTGGTRGDAGRLGALAVVPLRAAWGLWGAAQQSAQRAHADTTPTERGEGRSHDRVVSLEPWARRGRRRGRLGHDQGGGASHPLYFPNCLLKASIFACTACRLAS